MNWMHVANYCGLRAPYDFRIAVPLLLGLMEAISVLGVCLFFLLCNNLNVGTERFYFFAYILFLCAAAVATSRVRLLSIAIFSWCTLELGLAILGPHIGLPLFPPDYFTPARNNSISDRFMFHPLLQRVPKPNWQGHASYVVDARNKDVGPLKNWPFNWKAIEGQHFTFSHNSLGLRNAELTEADLRKDMIFVYGGSTTYDVAVTQGETWVERLQEELNGEVTIVNFGVSTHSTVEHLISTAFYQNIVQKKPVCAIYYVGWNDLWHAHVPNFDAAYVDYHGPLSAIRKPELLLAKYSPALRLVSRFASWRFDTFPYHRSLDGMKPIPGPDTRLEQVFSEHIRTIAAINRSRDIKSIFIGQLLNREFLDLAPKSMNALARLVKNEDTWPLQKRLNAVLKEAATSSGAVYVDAGIENFSGDDFVDVGHFVSAGSRKFARLISGEIKNHCRSRDASLESHPTH